MTKKFKQFTTKNQVNAKDSNAGNMEPKNEKAYKTQKAQ